MEAVRGECSGTERTDPSWVSGRLYLPDAPVMSKSSRKVARQIFATPAAQVATNCLLAPGNVRAFTLQAELPPNIPPSFKVTRCSVVVLKYV